MILSKLKVAVAAVCLVAVGSVNAHTNVELEAMQAYTITAEKQTAVLFYTKLDSGQYEVVTTVGSNPDQPELITRHRVILDEGQSYSFALDQGDVEGGTQSFQVTALSDTIFLAQR